MQLFHDQTRKIATSQEQNLEQIILRLEIVLVSTKYAWSAQRAESEATTLEHERHGV